MKVVLDKAGLSKLKKDQLQVVLRENDMPHTGSVNDMRRLLLPKQVMYDMPVKLCSKQQLVKAVLGRPSPENVIGLGSIVILPAACGYSRYIWEIIELKK